MTQKPRLSIEVAFDKDSDTEVISSRGTETKTYKFHLKDNGTLKKWTIVKRYSDFHAFDKEWGRSKGKYLALKLPSKGLLGFHARQTSDSRATELHKYMQDLVGQMTLKSLDEDKVLSMFVCPPGMGAARGADAKVEEEAEEEEDVDNEGARLSRILKNVSRRTEGLVKETLMLDRFLELVSMHLEQNLDSEKPHMQDFKALLAARSMTNGSTQILPKTFVKPLLPVMQLVQELNAGLRKKKDAKIYVDPQIHLFLLDLNPVFGVLEREAEDHDSDEEEDPDDETNGPKVTDVSVDKLLSVLKLVYELMQHVPKKLIGEHLTRDDIKMLGRRIACSSLGMQMAKNSNAKTQRIAFVGAESVGKSSLINYLVNVDKNKDEDVLPAAPGMGTQMMCIVKDSPHTSITVDGETYPGQNPQVILDKVEEQTKKIKDKRKGRGQDRAFDMDSPFILAKTPFKGPAKGVGANIELMDVPGLKDETELDTVIAFGLATGLVLCAAAPANLKSALMDPQQLQRLPQILRESAQVSGRKPIPMIICATRCTQGEYNEEMYSAVLKEFFGTTNKQTLMFANCFGMASSERADVVREFFKTVEAQERMESEEKAYFTGLRDELNHFLINLEQAVEKLFDRSSFDINFLKCEKDTKAKMAEFTPNIAEFTKTVVTEVDLSLEVLTQVLDNLPSYKILVGGNMKNVMEDRLYVAEDLIFEVRLGVMKFLTSLSDELFGLVWGTFEPFATEMLPEDGGMELKPGSMNKIVIANSFCQSIANHQCKVEKEVLKQKATGKQLKDLENRKGIQDNWERHCSDCLNRFCYPTNFRWFVMGYYIVKTDVIVKDEFLKEFVSKSDQPKQSQMVFGDFPNTWPEVEDVYAKYVHRWVNELRKLESEGKTTEQLDVKVVDCALEAYTVCQDMIKNSNVFTPVANPLVAKLAEMTKAMIQRLFITYSFTSKQYVFSDFGAKFSEKYQLGDTKVLGGIMKELTVNTKMSAFATVSNLSQAVDMMMNDEQMKDAKDQGEALVEIVEKMSKDANIIEKPQKDNRCVLVCFGSEHYSGADMGFHQEMERCFTESTEDTDSSVVFAKPAADQMGPFIAEVRWKIEKFSPKVLVWWRKWGIMSTDPQPNEISFIEMLRGHPCLASLIVVTPSDRDFIEPCGGNWQKCAGDVPVEFLRLMCTSVKDISGTPSYSFPAEGDAGGKAVNLTQLCRKLDNVLTDSPEILERRIKNAKSSFNSAKAKVMAELGYYKNRKQQTKSAQDFQQFIAKHEMKEFFHALKKRGVKFEGQPPTADYLLAVFRGEIQTQLEGVTLAHLQEFNMRAFLFKTMFASITKSGENFAECFYQEVAWRLKEYVANDFFHTSVEKLQKEIDEYQVRNAADIEKQREEISESHGSGPEQQRQAEQLHDLENLKTVCEFLSKEAIVSMYVGCSALSVAPLLYGIIYPCLVLTETEKLLASQKLRLKKASGYNSSAAQASVSNPGVSAPESNFSWDNYMEELCSAILFYQKKRIAFGSHA